MNVAKAVGASLIGLMSMYSLDSRADPGPPSVVYPMGIYPSDVATVQAALDRGGTVILKAVNVGGIPTPFNFGTGVGVGQSSGVFLNKDVSIRGERAGSSQTTILGGFLPILGLQPVKSAIQGIAFENSIWTAITIGASTGSVITDNTFHNVVPVRVRVPSGRIITFAQAIGFSGYNSSVPAPDLITGHVVLARNTIDGARAIFSNGIQFDSFNADAEIVGNNITNVNDDTTETGYGILVIRAANRVTIAGNVIAPGPTQNFGAGGIFIGGNREARYVVTANTVRVVSTFPDGIDITGGGTTGTVEASVVANSVSLNGTFSFGIFLWDLVTKTKVAANSIEGQGMFAMGISTFGFNTNIANLNSFLGNDPRNFVANQADLFYDTNAQGNAEIGFVAQSLISVSATHRPAAPAIRSVHLDWLPQARSPLHARRGVPSRSSGSFNCVRLSGE